MVSLLLRRLALLGALLALLPAHADPDLSQVLPIGTQVLVGQLDNGLTYYIQRNNRPEKRLELRLAVKAGSILEDEDQLGLAHVTEHMAFNGSAHFQKHDFLSAIRRAEIWRRPQCLYRVQRDGLHLAHSYRPA